MIIVQLKGGLGNQMFQYAMGRSLARRLNLPLKLDITNYKNSGNREYRLKFFQIKADIAEMSELSELIPNKKKYCKYLTEKVLENITPWHKRSVIKSREFNYERDIEKVNNSCYLIGYWQSEKYFKDIENSIRKELELKEQFKPDLRKYLKEIQTSNSVSIHIRRGDYANNPKIKFHYGLLGLDYYKRGINLLEEREENLKYFIFSDDINWVKEYLNFNSNVVFIDENKVDEEYLDLYYMSNCKHHIIANSSFSWWGAWLGKNKKKIVIAPKNWFNAYTPKKTKDLYCTDWIIT